jgi:hypothetical protein
MGVGLGFVDAFVGLIVLLIAIGGTTLGPPEVGPYRQ